MDILPLNKVVTSFFLVATIRQGKKGLSLVYKGELNFLSAHLVRTAAQKIFIPANITHGIFPETFIEKTIEKCPPSLASKIEVVDKNREIYNKVARYLQPASEEIEDEDTVLRGTYAYVFDFLYKLALASKHQAEADIHQLPFVGSHIDMLKQNVKNAEAKFRLDQLFGIYSSYQKPKKIDTLTPRLDARNIRIRQRVFNILDEVEIQELSKNRHLLGIPSKAEVAMKKIKKCVREISAKYSEQITAATDLIRILASLKGVQVPTTSVYELLKTIEMSPYNPPLIDLDYFRFRIARETHSAGFALALGNGTITAQYPPRDSKSARNDYHQYIQSYSNGLQSNDQ
jgi:hypothetical protein